MEKIFCKERNGMHEFYLILGREEFYMFSQKYKFGVDRYYRNGVLLNKGIRHGIGKSDRAIHHTIDKVKRYIRYIEDEYGFIILDQTKIKSSS